MSSAVTGTGTTPAQNAGQRAPSGDIGAVDVKNWSFFGRQQEGSARPTPFLVGPIVGAVTEGTARVLVEMERDMAVTMKASMDGKQICSATKNVKGMTPTVFKLEGFRPGRRVHVVVDVGEFGQDREARFMTTSDKTQWKIGAVSCNCHTHIEELGLWDRLAKVAGEVDCVLHLGDQIYADEDFGAKSGGGVRFESAWHACLTTLEPVAKADWDAYRPQLLEHYRKTYRKTWNMPAVAAVLASTANYMICDDHEFVDDLGDEPEHRDPSRVEFYVARVGYQVYCEYQKQLLTDIDVTDHTLRPYYAFRLSPKLGFFMTDNRVERSLHRGEGTEAEWTNRDFLGPRQWARVKQAFDVDFADCETVLFGAPTPLVFISQAATGVAEKVIDDARGTWGHRHFIEEQKALAHLLSEWQSKKANRAVVTLAGDVHIGGFTDSWHDKDTVPLHQMTASAIGNTPEKNVDAFKEMVMRGVMHADERMFKFKVKHHDWIYGPNYGMVDIELTHTSRPNIALTLVPHVGRPKIRNLELGQASVDVTNPEQSAASKAAYEAAAIMGASPPEARTGGAPGCGCSCSVS